MLRELVYNITSEQTKTCPIALPSAGDHSLLSIAFVFDRTLPQEFVVTKIQLSDEADTTAPRAVTNLGSSMVSLSEDAPESVVRIAWEHAVDAPGPTGASTGVSRYNVYRNGALYDMVNYDWTKYYKAQGGWIEYFDQFAQPESTYTYAVTAIDNAKTGLYKTLTAWEQTSGNESTACSTRIRIPPFSSPTVFNPYENLHYQGCFQMPSGPEWIFAGQGLTWYPQGNAQRQAQERHGSLYVIGHDQSLPLGEIAIPQPKKVTSAADAPRARLLQGPAYPWPAVYEGKIFPAGSVGQFAGLTYHPGRNGVGEGLYYGVCKQYSGDVSAPVHGWFSLTLDSAVGPWHGGAVPTHNEVVAVTELLRYSGSEVDKWANGWTQNHGYYDVVWLDAGKKAVVFTGARPVGDEWYGGENGFASALCDADRPATRGNNGSKGQVCTERINYLYFYSPYDLARVARGRMHSFEPQAYARLELSSVLLNGRDMLSGLRGMTYNAFDKELYVYEHINSKQGGEVVHVWKVDSTPFTPPDSLTMGVTEQKGWLPHRWDCLVSYSAYHKALSITSSHALPLRVTLLDLSGHCIASAQLNAKGPSTPTIWHSHAFSDLSRGIYVARVSREGLATSFVQTVLMRH